MRIATWNVNSVNARLETVLAWFRDANPDVAVLQELKCVDEKFPREAFEALGYQVEVHGQKSWNGVAFLSKTAIEDVRRGLPLPDGEEDEQSRYIEAVTGGATPVRVGGLYLPNGNPIETEKFPYKLRWMARLRAHAAELLQLEEPLVLAGDYNVIPTDSDVWDAGRFANDALVQPQSRSAWRSIKALGFTDAWEQLDGREHAYTYWDYQAGAWQRNHGMRIDHLLLSPQAADRLTGYQVHKDARAMDKPSDHVPVSIELDLAREAA